MNPEYEEILYPVGDDEYRPIPYTIRGVTSGGVLQVALGGVGMAPHHFITQRGPFQDGSTPLDMRWDERTVDIEITQAFRCRVDYWDRRWDMADWLRPNRSFDVARIAPQTLIFRHWMPGGKMQRGVDLRLTAGSAIVRSNTGRFIHWGLKAGESFTITGSIADDGTYTVVDVPNDYTVELDANMTNDETGIHWGYRRDHSLRDLYLLLSDGPGFNEPGEQIQNTGYREVLRYVAHDPFWYGAEQSETWEIEAGAQGDLVFDGLGAWFGPADGDGRWLFAETYVGESVDIVYWGHESALPIIEIAGPAADPTIRNDTLDIALFLSYTIATGETITINTLNLTCENNTGDNLSAYLSGDLANFAISPDPQAEDRINEIAITYISRGSGSTASISWRNRYASL